VPKRGFLRYILTRLDYQCNLFYHFFIGIGSQHSQKLCFHLQYAKPNSGIGFPGALELIIEVFAAKLIKIFFSQVSCKTKRPALSTQCKNAGLKVAVASSADRIKVDANLAAACLPVSL
jgi:hypothetical protein